MRKIDNLFVTISLIAAIAVSGTTIWKYTHTSDSTQIKHQMPDTQFGNFLAAQHAIYVNDFVSANNLADKLNDVQYPVVQNTKLISEFLGGHLPYDAKLLKNEKGMPAQLIYDAYLIKNNDWKELHNRHKNDEGALTAPLRIWSAIANDWRTNTFKFIDKLPTNDSWKSFVRGQIYAELKKPEEAAKHFDKVSIDFININDYLYLMSFYTHHNMPDAAQQLYEDFTSRPGGMFMQGYDNIPDWGLYTGYANALAFSLVQNVSHTQFLMYSDLSMLLLRFAQITAPEFAAHNNTVDYYIGQYFFNNVGDWESHFEKINPQSPFYLFAIMRASEKTNDIKKLQAALDAHPLFVPAINKVVGYYVQHGNKRAALRTIKRALSQDGLDDAGRAFFLKSRAYVHFAFGDLNAAQNDLRDASDILIVDTEILSLQAKIWAAQNREIENAYEYAMTLVAKNPSDILAWDTLGYVVATREGVDAALDVLERVGEVSETCSSLFMHLGDMYAEIGENQMAIDAYMRAIDLSDDGLVVVPEIERKIRKLK